MLAIAAVDWWTKPYVSLGFLYLFPIMLAAGFLPRWAIALAGVSCAVLAELFSSLDRSFVLRDRSSSFMRCPPRAWRKCSRITGQSVERAGGYRLTTHPDGLLNPSQRPPRPPQRYWLLFLFLGPDIADKDGGYPPSGQCPESLWLTGFQVITAGWFWAFTEVQGMTPSRVWTRCSRETLSVFCDQRQFPRPDTAYSAHAMERCKLTVHVSTK